ncbi:MAG: hypothetical protein QGH73_03800 [Rhodospirillales bacterium]|jgi:hypothetical protein|nr:hypothetical protein [Rhodospirillaceae bacterium]MDP6427094.1 hypothetical protein [Rhodospirillales bacterium]MDP6643448.1 hypothetical protein [Rhodospirillales bacterium]MDP6840782.1 hypothetical protein [Rhodospirillales bacterium]|tara:strand:+ start:5119 stop:6450 length:1332 start_codon:yes stop_codon:yes gene_type:complete
MSGTATALASTGEPDPIDWEAVFEADGHGLIALIGETKSFAALKSCMLVIVEQLFSRDNDEAFRESYIAELNSVLPDDLDGRENMAATLDKLKAAMVATLRRIKSYRIEKAEQARLQSAADTGALTSGERRSDANDDTDMLIGSVKATDITDEDEREVTASVREATAKIFADVVSAEYKNRFKALRMGISQEAGGKVKLPFMLSGDFAKKFDAVLCQYVIPEFTQRCHELVTRGVTRSADRQKSYFQQFTGFETGRGEIWEHWSQTWTDVTAKQKLPTRPTGKGSGKKKKGMFGISLKKASAAESEAADAELERWKARIAQLEKTNGLADAVWDALCEDSDSYMPPIRDTDSKTLMDLFGRSTKSIMKQVHAINQIVQQGDEVARAFEVLQQGKDVEVCLLAACFQRPELYLGRKQMLKQLLGGFRGTHFPLILRYLPQHIRE